MITYDKSPFGLNLLFRLSGSCVYRATLTGSLSVGFLLLSRLYLELTERKDPRQLDHPYAIGVLVSSTTFLLVFRVQQAYARYWEAAGSVNQMLSKWMDAVIHTANYHMQCSHYNAIKPPSYFEYPEMDNAFLTRDRERNHDRMNESARIMNRAVKKSIEYVRPSQSKLKPSASQRFRHAMNRGQDGEDQSHLRPTPLEGYGRLDGNWGALFDDDSATYFDAKNPTHYDPRGFASFQGGRTPPLFLQELSHLTSLLTGVALATLRSDIEGAESPLDIYIPGSPWPVMDPDKEKDLAFRGLSNTFLKRILDYLGAGRSAEERTRYNACRPLPVLGGVSEAEIIFLQKARGPYAKTVLCWGWLSEFITREHLAGSTGNVGPPIISRIIQFLSDGMICYNHARKIANIPFPFPHAQLSAVYVMFTIPAVAILMDQYTNDLWLGSILTFLTVTCLSGIHEVARELENPFRNVPNELPVLTWQAQFNEALITMYAGYHPDGFWRDAAEHHTQRVRAKKERRQHEGNNVLSGTADNNTNTSGNGNTNNSTSTSGSNPEVQSMEEKMAALIQKINAQGAELERMRSLMGGSERCASEGSRD